MSFLKSLASAILATGALFAIGATPAQAQTVSFGYIGTDQSSPLFIPGNGTLINVTEAVGSFTFIPFFPIQSIGTRPSDTPLSQSVTFGLDDLADFTLDTSTILTFSEVNPAGLPSSAFYSYSKQDLTHFSATFNNDVLTALSFETVALTPASISGGGRFGFQNVRVTGFGADGFQTLNGDGIVQTSGRLEIAAVPEPASWAMMIIGFGAVGGAMRVRRRRQFAAVSAA